MQAQTINKNRAAIKVAFSEPTARQALFTVEQFAADEPAFTPAAIRNLIFKAEARQSSKGEIPGNGLIECGAIVRIGRKVLIDKSRFLEWARGQSA